MRHLLIAAAALSLTSVAAPASAYLVEITTSVSTEGLRDEAQLKEAVRGAVDSVLKDAIAFKPTVVVLTHAVVRSGRLYLRLLIADEDGERAFDDLDEATPEAAEKFEVKL
jgi:hypothetical protein